MLRFHLALALRSLSRRPGFALAAILLLALDPGANAVGCSAPAWTTIYPP